MVTALLVCLLSALSLSQAAFGQASSRRRNPYLHQTWTTENGLPVNSIVQILQTRDGYLWLGTFGGLVRFDGVQFKVFNSVNTPGLGVDRIRVLYEDNERALWIGSNENGGLTRYRDGVFTTFTMRDGLPDNTVLSIAGDRQGGIWIGTMRGLTRYYAGKFTSYLTKPGMPKGQVPAIWQDKTGRLWLGTDGQGLISWSAGGITTYGVKDGLRSNSIGALHETRDGTLWVGTKKGLVRIKNGKISRVLAKDGRPVGWVRGFAEDRRGTLWVASWNGLLRWQNGELTRFTRKDHLTSAGHVRSVFVDREDDLWFGTDGRGLTCWRKSNLVAYTAEQGLSDQAATAIYQDHRGTIWIAIGSRLFAFRNGVFRAYVNRPGHLLRRPMSLAEDQKGDLWIGDWANELLRLKDGQVISYPELPLPRDEIRNVYVDSRDAVWIGTNEDGVYRFRDGKLTNYRAGNDLADNDVSYITEGHGGALWLATFSGITRFQNGRFTTYQTPGLSAVRDIYACANGTLWIGTYGYGLFRFKGGKFARITSKNGLFGDFVSAILEDNRGNLWMAGNRGIFRVAEKELNAFADGKLPYVASVSYGVRDGMKVSETNGVGEPTACKARDGKLWFAMTQGVVVINPDVTDTVRPPVVIDEVTVDGKTVPSERPLRIGPDQSNLEIHYAALSFRRPGHVTYRYKLAGADRHWVIAGKRRTTYFPHLAPGKYSFTVIADNGDGVWNLTGASVEVVVAPPFWRTRWFLSVVLIILTGIGMMAFRLRIARLRATHAAQEAFSRQLLASQEAERKRVAAALHDSLGQSLLIIKNRADMGLSSIENREAAKEQLNEISAAASQAVDEVRKIAYRLRPYQLDRFGLTKTLQAICHQASHASEIRCLTEMENIDGLFSTEAETNIYRIVQEAINNIIRHSQATEAKLEIRSEGHELQLRISDNGKGFVPTTQSMQDPQRPGGFGFVGLAERVRMLNGSYQIESSPGHGTTITILLPIPGGPNER